MAEIRLLLLGPPRIERDGAPVEVDTRKAVALLAYLAITQGRHTRDALAVLLWPEYGTSRARAALRRTLSSLSPARQEGWLEVDRAGVGPVASRVWVDVDRFRELMAECRTHGHPEGEVCQRCLPPLEEAAVLYRDDFLAGFGLRDSFAFDEWQYFQAEGLRRELAGVLERLARGRGAREEWEPAIAYARRWLALDPLHEPAHRSLMRLYAHAGRRADALRQYRECVRILEKELGVSPLEETTRLYQEIKEDHPLPPPSFYRSATGSPEEEASSSSEPPAAGLHKGLFVGRAAEWEALLRAYDAAETGSHVAILEGEAGIGKTRLAEEFLAHVASRGAATVAARCYPGETNLAYGPFVEGLSAAIERGDHTVRLQELPVHSLSEAARLLPELAGLFPNLPPPPPLETPGARSRFFEGIGQVLLAVCGGRAPGVLFLDDLHWADDASLDLLAYLVRRVGSSGRLLFLLTWRSEQVPVVHRLRGMVAEARRDGAVTALTLPRLDRAAVEELVLPLAGEPGTLARRLYEETEGLPLFLGEYLKVLEEGVADGGDEAWPLPGSVRELLLGRLAAISETGWQLLTAAAAIGRSFGFDAVREGSGRGEEEAVAALEELVSQGLVKEAGDREQAPTYDFGHEKLRDLVYEETSLARRRLLHRRVAEALAGKGRREIGALSGQIAHHYRLAGWEAEAAEYFKLAGEHARTLYANAEALSHFQTALALGHPDTAALREAVGDLHTLLGDYGAALASYESAGAFSDGATLAAIERKLGLVHQRRGDWELAESHYRAALEALEDSGSANERAGLYADLSLATHHLGRTDEAAALARRALVLAEAAGDARDLAHAHNMMGILAGSKGDPDAARHHLERSLKLAEELDDPYARVAALNNLARAHGSSGKTGKAIEQTEAALDLCSSLGDRHREAALHNNLADLLHTAGRSEEAMDHLKQAVAIFAEVGEEGVMQPGIWKLAEW